ncbi:MAG: BTAD domain-containing putative transcriptional regulator [Gemmatimonadales bacterium]
MTLFWPDSDQPHARGALSQSLRYLRRSLGEGAIVTLGEDEVGLDRELVGCDAVVFADRCEAAQFEEALAIYQGPFLDGFFVSDAGPEFERWVAGERMRLGHQAGEAAKTLSERAEGRTDPAAAVRWARRAALLGRGDEAAAARLIRLLDQVGDRAGALREYDALRQRLKEEFQVPPSPETQRLITLILGR